MAQRVFSFFLVLMTSQCNIVELPLFFVFFRSGDAHNNQACDDDRAPTLFRQSVGREKKKRRQSEEENLLKRIAGRWNETARYFASLWFVLLTLALFLSVCLCVYAVVYGIHIRQCMCSSKLKTGKKRRTISRRVGWGETKETRRRERGSCVCVCQ